MNNTHLPAGRAAHGAGVGPGMADISSAGYGMPQGTNGAVHGHNGHTGHNGYNGHNGHHGGRGGGARRGRHYNNNNNGSNNYNGYNYNNQHHVLHGQHNTLNHLSQQGQHGQFPQQMYAQQGYMPPYNNQQFGYPPMPPPMAPNYMQYAQQQQQQQYQQQQYQQPPYGRPIGGMQGQYAPMGGAPMGMHPMAPPGVLPHQHAPMGPLAQHSPALPHVMPQPHAPAFAGTAQHTPLIVSTPQPDHFAMHGAIPPLQSPPVVHSTFLPSAVQAPLGLPPSLPPHNPIPPHGDVHRSVSGNFGAPTHYSGVVPAVAATPTAPLAGLSPSVTTAETSSVPVQQNEELNGSITTPSSEAEPTPTSDVTPAKIAEAEISLSPASEGRIAPVDTSEAAPIDPSKARKPYEKPSVRCIPLSLFWACACDSMCCQICSG